MALTYKARRRLSLVVLLIGLPAYIVVAITMVSWLERPSIWMELAVYVGLGMVWILPLRSVFLGVGQPDPDVQAKGGRADDRTE